MKGTRVLLALLGPSFLGVYAAQSTKAIDIFDYLSSPLSVGTAFSFTDGPYMAAYSYTWSQYITPTVIGTVYVTVNEANHKTISNTVYHSAYKTNGSMALLTRTDTNKAGTVTTMMSNTAVTYPHPYLHAAPSMSWGAILPVSSKGIYNALYNWEDEYNNAVTINVTQLGAQGTCCIPSRIVSATPSHTPWTIPGSTNRQDPSGWLYTLVGAGGGHDAYTELGPTALSSLWTPKPLSVPYKGCPHTMCKATVTAKLAGPANSVTGEGNILVTTSTTISSDDPLTTSKPSASTPTTSKSPQFSDPSATAAPSSSIIPKTTQPTQTPTQPSIAAPSSSTSTMKQPASTSTGALTSSKTMSSNEALSTTSPIIASSRTESSKISVTLPTTSPKTASSHAPAVSSQLAETDGASDERLLTQSAQSIPISSPFTQPKVTHSSTPSSSIAAAPKEMPSSMTQALPPSKSMSTSLVASASAPTTKKDIPAPVIMPASSAVSGYQQTILPAYIPKTTTSLVISGLIFAQIMTPCYMIEGQTLIPGSTITLGSREPHTTVVMHTSAAQTVLMMKTGGVKAAVQDVASASTSPNIGNYINYGLGGPMGTSSSGSVTAKPTSNPSAIAQPVVKATTSNANGGLFDKHGIRHMLRSGSALLACISALIML